MRIAPAITLSPEERTGLESQARSRSLPVRVAERARIVLLAAAGQQDKEIAVVMAVTWKKVSRWRKRFLALGRSIFDFIGVLPRRANAPRPGGLFRGAPPVSTRRKNEKEVRACGQN